MPREQANGILGALVMIIDKPILASVDVVHQEALKCLQDLITFGGKDDQCLICEYNEFCSGAFQHVLIGSDDEN